MTARRLILVANDNRPAAKAADATAYAHVAKTQSANRAATGQADATNKQQAYVPEQTRPETAKAKSRPIGRWTALTYQALATGLLGFGVIRGLDLYAVGGLAILATLGGLCALIGWHPEGWLRRAGRSLCAIFAGLTAIFALILLVPTDVMSGLQDPLLIAGLIFAALGATFRLRSLLLVALSGLALLLLKDPLTTLPLTMAVQVGCILALCAMGAYRARSGLILSALAIFTVGLLWVGLTEASLNIVQAFGTVGLTGASMWAVGLLLSQKTDRLAPLHETGSLIALGAALAAQFALLDAAIGDGFLQPTMTQSYLAAFLVAIQGVVLISQLFRWLSGRIGWLGVLLPQLILAAIAMVVIDPTALERLIAIPDSVDMPRLYALSLGAIVGAIALFGLWDSWFTDRPVRTGSFAMIVMVQIALTWQAASHSFDVAVLAGVAFVGAVCAVLLCRAFRKDDGRKTAITPHQNTHGAQLSPFQARS